MISFSVSKVNPCRGDYTFENYCIQSIWCSVRMDRPTRKHGMSVDFFLKGDAYMSETKTVLGWVNNTVDQTIEVPEHRKQQLLSIFTYLSRRTGVPLKKWHQILGELRSMVIGIPGSRGLFSMLQLELQKVDSNGHIHLTGPTRRFRGSIYTAHCNGRTGP